MTRKPSYRYKCDFCGKTSGSGGHMARHEKHCTLNPQRVCRVCKETGLEEQDMATLIAALGTGDAAGVKALESLAERCPACMLAAIRQSGLQRHDTWESRGCHALRPCAAVHRNRSRTRPRAWPG